MICEAVFSAFLANCDCIFLPNIKRILKRLEKSNITKSQSKAIKNEEIKKELSETERIIKDIDLNNLSPMQAFNILAELKDKVEN